MHPANYLQTADRRLEEEEEEEGVARKRGAAGERNYGRKIMRESGGGGGGGGKGFVPRVEGNIRAWRIASRHGLAACLHGR